jgi:hypothetical protein
MRSGSGGRPKSPILKRRRNGAGSTLETSRSLKERRQEKRLGMRVVRVIVKKMYMNKVTYKNYNYGAQKRETFHGKF